MDNAQTEALKTGSALCLCRCRAVCAAARAALNPPF